MVSRFVVSDATAAATLGEDDGYAAALTNFRFISSGVMTTAEAVTLINGMAQ